MYNYETLKELTVEELKDMCKDLGLRGYSKLNEDDIIEKLLSSGKLEAKEEIKETNDLNFEALRTIKTKSKGDVKGKFTLTKEQFEKDIGIQKAIKFGYVVKL